MPAALIVCLRRAKVDAREQLETRSEGSATVQASEGEREREEVAREAGIRAKKRSRSRLVPQQERRGREGAWISRL